MLKYRFHIILNSLFGNIYRGKHVLIAPIDRQNKVILGSKPDFYPPQIYRLIGGGIEGNESLKEAAVREIKEELSLDIDKHTLGKSIDLIFNISYQGKKYSFITYLFIYKLTDSDHIKPGSDIADTIAMTSKELKQLVDRYYALPQNSWYHDPRSKYRHDWADYGKVYGKIHEILYQQLENTQ